MNQTFTPQLQLPGFRFHPTEEELVEFYLKGLVFRKTLTFHIIGFLNIYHYNPSDLPGLSKIGEREWYFFVPIDRKHGNGGRPNRTTENGFWKATGSDRKIVSLSEPNRVIGLKKTLVFYKGRAPRGTKTDWVMNEFRLPDGCPLPKEVVLCKIYRKATSLKVLEQRAAMEEEMKISLIYSSPSSMEVVSFCGQQEDLVTKTTSEIVVLKKETEDVEMTLRENTDVEHEGSHDKSKVSKGCHSEFPFEKEKLEELQVPKLGMEWPQDSIWNLSPWRENFTPYANILNF